MFIDFVHGRIFRYEGNKCYKIIVKSHKKSKLYCPALAPGDDCFIRHQLGHGSLILLWVACSIRWSISKTQYKMISSIPWLSQAHV